ncbi:MAG: DUF4350 domain-containing protein [Microbacteriaceae bacterium]|nr:DUF4350 domain-containing protein [Cryobacterium sp.]MCC6376341.1 DUF4350 domain-containing protein [Microbacteriaceae bacterium]
MSESATTIASTVKTPTLKGRLRSARFWLILSGAILALVALMFLMLRPSYPDAKLSAESPTPQGSKALAEVLKSQGVEVVAANSMKQVREFSNSPSDTTIFLYDPNSFLSGLKLRELTRVADVIVVMNPTFNQMLTLTPEVAAAGKVSGSSSASCDFRPATQAETVTIDGYGFRLISPNDDSEVCFPSQDGTYSLIKLKELDTTVIVLGTVSAFTNQEISKDGNAALAIGTLGSRSRLIWMLPSITESDLGYAQLSDLAPKWITPLIAFSLIVFVTAGIWRGRRFGRLVPENLPVFVPASETVEGRARLYAASSAKLRALDSLRIGTISRLSKLCGLTNSATIDEVLSEVARLTKIPIAELNSLFLDLSPEGEKQLIQLSERLLEIEARTKSAIWSLSSDVKTQETTKTKQENST